jgi:light-regulated signal transduction histidine kinase (bacteriophytochrome)
LEAFAYSASHDLKEPLRTIATSAEWIERRLGPRLSAPDTDFLARIQAETRRMDELIDHLLLYSQATKIEPGPPPLVDSSRVLAEVLESLSGQIEASGAVVTQGALPPVAMHEGSLARLFQNLISNGIKYRGQEPPRIHITAGERGGACVFSVSDNGIGIDSQFGDQIFGLFNRLHGRDAYPGSGVGLAICKRVVEQYGGRMWLEKSEPGAGSMFCFSVPKPDEPRLTAGLH